MPIFHPTPLAKNKSSIWLIVLPSLLFASLLGLPILALLLEGAGTDLSAMLKDAHLVAALGLSLSTSATSTLFAVLTGTPLAYALARWNFRGRSLLELILDLPIVLPPSVAGLALLLAFGRRGLLGDTLAMAGLQIPFTTLAVMLAQLFVAGPLFVRAARIGFGAVDKQLEEAAVTEGASQWQLLRQVMVPAAGQALVGGALLCWARALGEFGATLLFAGNLVGRTQTMPLAIYVSLESDRDLAVALAIFLLLVSGAILALMRKLERNWQVS